MDPLRQPWRAYLEQKAAVPTSHTPIADDRSSINEDGPMLCPGGPDCPSSPHELGSTKNCAFSAKVEVPMGPTGTSG